MEEGIDWDIGGCLFDQLMYDSGFCKKRDEHKQAWHKNNHDFPNNCDCDFVAEYGPIYVVVLQSGKQYVIHPDENIKVHKFQYYKN